MKKTQKPKVTKQEKESSKYFKKVEEERKKLAELSETEQFLVIKQKVANSSKNLDEKKLRLIAQGLSTEKGIKQSYLNKNFQTTLDYFQNIPKQKKETFVSGFQSDVPISDSQEQQDEDIVIGKEDLEDLIKTNEKLKIKLVITEITKSENEKNLRKLLSPVMSTLNIGPKCGKIYFLNFYKECFTPHFL
jgi:hypothetical protein